MMNMMITMTWYFRGQIFGNVISVGNTIFLGRRDVGTVNLGRVG
jgi:hypothetical protein